jgi:hypothetical protein
VKIADATRAKLLKNGRIALDVRTESGTLRVID